MLSLIRKEFFYILFYRCMQHLKRRHDEVEETEFDPHQDIPEGPDPFGLRHSGFLQTDHAENAFGQDVHHLRFGGIAEPVIESAGRP